MLNKRLGIRVILVLLLCSLFLVMTQAGQQQARMLILTGHAGELVVVEIGGRSYVEIQAFAQLANASLSSNGNQILLTLPGSSAHTDPSAPSAGQPAPTGLSKEFIRAGIEEMSIVREWRSTLKNAVQRGYPITEDWIGSFRDQGRTSLRLVGVAATTDSDRNTFQLLTNVFNNMNKLSDQFLEANRTRTYIAPDALNNHPLDQRILNCAHSLAAMAANGQFMDDGSCH